MKLKIAIIGSRGIPAKYGGFETFVEEISKRLVNKGYEIYVSCEGGIFPKLHQYEGVKLFYFPLSPFYRVIYETLYDIYSLIKSCMICDSIYMLGYGAGFFFFIPHIFGKKILVNVDGIEWKRDKYSGLEKKILYFSEVLAVKFSDVVIADSFEIKKYIDSSYGIDCEFIAYGVEKPEIQPWISAKLISTLDNEIANIKCNNYYLVVARLEPENNIHLIVEGFLKADTDKKLIVVGNFLSNKYKSEIYEIIANEKADGRVIFTGGIYDKNLLNMLRQNCFAYFHGHSAGGTNPSLLEAMIMENIIIAHNNKFNKEVGSETILYFKDSVDVTFNINNLELNYQNLIFLKINAYKRVINHYSWGSIASKYDILFKNKKG